MQPLLTELTVKNPELLILSGRRPKAACLTSKEDCDPN